MGRMWLDPGILIPSVGEIVGYKSGLALTKEQMFQKLQQSEYFDTLKDSDNWAVTLRGEEFHFIILELLYQIGNIPSPKFEFPADALVRKYSNNRNKFKLAEDIIAVFIKVMGNDVAANSTLISSFLKIVVDMYGSVGLNIAKTFLKEIDLYRHKDVFLNFRRVEWRDIRKLSELFESESLNTYYGTFFDQRFIDYLHQNFDDIDNINWRKFEGLTAEFFDRKGFNVNLGKGRKDGGIDIRVWPKKRIEGAPPLILVQCKRVKQSIGEGVVKMLYADILDEKAESGLIVTSSSLSKPALNLCKARSYPITQADRKTLRKWIKAMRDPGTGVFLGK